MRLVAAADTCGVIASVGIDVTTVDIYCSGAVFSVIVFVVAADSRLIIACFGNQTAAVLLLAVDVQRIALRDPYALFKREGFAVPEDEVCRTAHPKPAVYGLGAVCIVPTR